MGDLFVGSIHPLIFQGVMSRSKRDTSHGASHSGFMYDVFGLTFPKPQKPMAKTWFYVSSFPNKRQCQADRKMKNLQKVAISIRFKMIEICFQKRDWQTTSTQKKVK